MSSGVFLTGLLLLRVCDPEYESPVLGNYSIGFSVMSAVTFAIMPLILNLILTKGTMTALLFTLALTLVGTVGAIISSKAINK